MLYSIHCQGLDNHDGVSLFPFYGDSAGPLPRGIIAEWLRTWALEPSSLGVRLSLAFSYCISGKVPDLTVSGFGNNNSTHCIHSSCKNQRG